MASGGRLWLWVVVGLVAPVLAVLALTVSPYGKSAIYADVDWYRSVTPALTSNAPLYDPRYLVPHALERPVFWDQAPTTALLATILLVPGGGWIWGIGMTAAVAGGLVLLWPRIGLRGTLLLAPVLVAWWPVTGALTRGNLNALVFLCLAVSIRFPRRAGWMIGLATVAKLAPAVMLFWLLGKRDWRNATIAVGIAVFATAVVVIWKGPGTLGDFVTLRMNQWAPTSEGSLRWGLAEVFGLSSAAALGVAGLFAIAAWRQASFSIGVIAMLVATPVMHVHYWIFLLVPLLAIWAPHYSPHLRHGSHDR